MAKPHEPLWLYKQQAASSAAVGSRILESLKLVVDGPIIHILFMAESMAAVHAQEPMSKTP